MIDDDEEKRPGPRRRRVQIDLPAIDDLAGVDRAEAFIIRAAAEDEISPRVALDFSTMLDRRRRTLADRNLVARLEMIEQARLEREKKKGGG
jgi:hypothetical protein